METAGFEGALIRASDLLLGAIVVRESIRRSGRKNFTIAHEIGHFVLPGHDRASLACTAADVANWASDAKAFRREVDEFGAELLIPAAVVKRIIKGVPPSLELLSSRARDRRLVLCRRLAVLRSRAGEMRRRVEHGRQDPVGAAERRFSFSPAQETGRRERLRARQQLAEVRFAMQPLFVVAGPGFHEQTSDAILHPRRLPQPPDCGSAAQPARRQLARLSRLDCGRH